MELCTGQAEAVRVARTHANLYRVPSIKCASACTSDVLYPFFTDSSYTAGVLALLFASILGVAEGETVYDQKCTWCGCEFTASLSKSGNFLCEMSYIAVGTVL